MRFYPIAQSRFDIPKSSGMWLDLSSHRVDVFTITTYVDHILDATTVHPYEYRTPSSWMRAWSNNVSL